MPQLDPTPWFPILLTSWLIFVTLTPIKISKYLHLNDPVLKIFKGSNKPWIWPWP
uniref:ATP synthase complex subunit 8 n=1 Tax=Hylodes meridionalis TaxID=209660 RepID=A0A0S2A2Z7_9NEOB|nr:ATP synthase F0 subunit 8 [Hylodes meridionalis]